MEEPEREYLIPDYFPEFKCKIGGCRTPCCEGWAVSISMDDYFNSYRDMISLRGLTDHTLKSYCTYIRAYLDYLQNILHKLPEDVSWHELRDFIRWLQAERGISDRTVNTAISQIRFFT